MKLRNWWRSLDFYWQIYLFTTFAFGLIIVVVELVLEPIVEALLGLGDGLSMKIDWYELPVWAVSVVVPALLFSLLLTRMVMRKLAGFDEATRRLAEGDLKNRVIVPEGREDVFSRLGASFNRMADSLDSLLTNEKRLLADISHELRSPLTRMALLAALLPKKCGTPEFAGLAQKLEEEIAGMTELVSTLLEQGRDRALALEPDERLRLRPVIAETASNYAFMSEEDERTFAIDVDPNLTLLASPARLRLIVNNLIRNATFYTPANGGVAISARRLANGAALSVRDFGPGVPERHLDDIFRPFFRIDESRSRDSGGAGLGLALVKETVEAMGGGVKARNADPGLEITITFPAKIIIDGGAEQ